MRTIANFLKELARKELLAPHLSRWFQSGVFPDQIQFSIHPNKERDDAFHPSSDGSHCARTIYASRKGHLAKRALGADSYKTFFFGHYFHSLIQYIVVQELGFSDAADIEKEQTYWAGKAEGMSRPNAAWWGRGFIDFAHCRIPGKGDFLIDIKTMGSHTYRLDRMPSSLWHKYYSQVQLYLDWEGMEQAIILCAEKDSPHRFKEFYIDHDQDFVNRIYRRWDAVAAADADPPECDCDYPADCPSRDCYK